MKRSGDCMSEIPVWHRRGAAMGGRRAGSAAHHQIPKLVHEAVFLRSVVHREVFTQSLKEFALSRERCASLLRTYHLYPGCPIVREFAKPVRNRSLAVTALSNPHVTE